MPNTKLLLFLLLMHFYGFSQNAPDTLQRRDTALIEEFQESVLDNIPVISLDENDISDVSAQNISSVLTAGRDQFFSAASFNWSPVRFRIRGYDADWFNTYINGIPMENLDNGFTPFGLWGGLNDVLRNRDISFGLRNNTFAFGEIGTTTMIDARASKQRAQTNINYAYSNRNYAHRVMLTHSTGLSPKGWAFTLSGSRRYASEGYVPGTFFDGWSYFAGIDKKIGMKHLISLVGFGAPTENGRQGPSVREMYELAGTNYYNPFWGFQNGKKRNSSVAKTHQPYIIFTHDYRINNNTALMTAVGYSFGERFTTAIDWYNAADPRPDYYRYLPSYYKNTDSALMVQLAEQMRANIQLRQIQWDKLYLANYSSHETIVNANGIAGNNVTGKRSHYILEERVIDSRRLNANSVLNTRITDHIDFTAGISYQQQRNHYFKRVNDLLGGEFYVDLNQFAERDFPLNPNANQNDLNRPNRILKTGDRFGYDYNINIHKVAGWAQGFFRTARMDFFVAGDVSRTWFWRVGHVRNGLFPDNSFGKSRVNAFVNYGVKGGLTYKIDGRNYLVAHAAYLTRAPFFENIYIAPRTRDFQQENPVSLTVKTAEAGYILNAPKLRLRLMGYYTLFENDYNVVSFYHDDYRNFVNYALSNIDRLHFGGELGFEARILPGLSLNGAAAVGRYYFNSRQEAIITLDNSASFLGKETIYNLNYRVPATPQEAYSFGFYYRSPKFWYLSLTANYFDQMWLDINPVRRTKPAVDGLDPSSEQWHQILRQTRWDAQYTLDFFGGYSWKLPKTMSFAGKSTFLVFNLGVNNLLNNQQIITGGFEQLRFDFDGKDVNKFPPRLFYGYGLNYFASVTLRF
ncbi:MAG: Plug domain-containing protein [Chitinophagaceae bacterium]|nr:Plug domain-containing protein [Chitinophagaceae bacterium]